MLISADLLIGYVRLHCDAVCQTAKLVEVSWEGSFLRHRPFFHELLIVIQSVFLSSQFLTMFSHSTLVNHLLSSGCFAAVLQQQFPLHTKCKYKFTVCYPLLLYGKSPQYWLKLNVASLFLIPERHCPLLFTTLLGSHKIIASVLKDMTFTVFHSKTQKTAECGIWH